VEAEPEALQIVARRASGSLRDGQSLLDRLLASGSPVLTVEIVNGLLGTASDERLLALVEALADHDPAACLRMLEQSASEGVQPAELLSGLIDFVRDALVLAVGADALLLSVSPRQRPQVRRIVERWTIDSILAALQILSECRSRMRGSLHGRLLVELALVRIARLEDLASLGSLVDRLSALESGAPVSKRPDLAVKKRSPTARDADVLLAEPPARPEPPPVSSGPDRVATASMESPVGERSLAPEPRTRDERRPRARSGPSVVGEAPAVDAVSRAEAVTHQGRAVDESSHALPRADSSEQASAAAVSSPLDLATARDVWPELLKKIGATLAWRLSQVEPVAVIAPDVLVIAANPGYNSLTEECGTAESLGKIELALQRLTHRSVTVKYEPSHEVDESVSSGRAPEVRPQDALAADPLVQRVLELFEARPHQFEYGDADPDRPA
jgi:DNA polymerase-3 subunit gamma/tau